MSHRQLSMAAALFLLAFSAETEAHGQSDTWASDSCLAPDILNISRPIRPGQVSSPTFQYAFRYVPGANANSPVVIYLPGGPGGTSISESRILEEDDYEYTPKGYGAVYTDPRGTGCNQLKESGWSDEVFFTDDFASDILAIIRSMKLKNYILKGSSYGTVLATVVAKKAALDPAVSLPQAIFLMGTVGHAFLGQSPYQGFQNEWNRISGRLSSQVYEQLLDTKRLPFDFSPSMWGTFIKNMLILGSRGRSIDLTLALRYLDSEDSNKLGILRQMIVQLGHPVGDQNFLKVFRPIWCSELAQSSNGDLALVRAELVGNQDPDFCQGYKLIHPYDSSEWQVAIPIYYLQGENDPVTTSSQALYHFEHQPLAERHFVLFAGGGHDFPISQGCQRALLDSVQTGKFDASIVLAQCVGASSIR